MEQISFSFAITSAQYTRAELALLTPDEIYQCADEELLVKLKEDRRLERKPAGVHAAELGEYYCMWANTVGGGLIVIGQEDGGHFSGCAKLSQERLNTLEKSAEWHCADAKAESRRIAVHLPSGELDFVVLFRVYYNERRAVKDCRGKVFVRTGDSIKEVKKPDDIRALEIAKGQVDLEQEPVDLRYPDDFKISLIRSYVDGVVRMKRLSGQHTDEEILSHGRLGKLSGNKFTPNVACTLLFAKDPLGPFPGCKIRILRYDGEVEKTGKDYNVVKDFFVEGSIPDIIVECARQLRSMLREFSRLYDDGRFYTAPEYPEPAWYEGIVNACVHRSYHLKNMVTFVKIFDDKLIIESPGGFPPPLRQRPSMKPTVRAILT